jgi:hypothetical protein
VANYTRLVNFIVVIEFNQKVGNQVLIITAYIVIISNVGKLYER